MYKTTFMKKIRVALAFTVVLSLIPAVPAFADANDAVKIAGQQAGVDLDKSWLVTFTKDIDKSSVTSDTVKIVEVDPTKDVPDTVPTEIQFFSDSAKAFRVKPKANYGQSKKYRLIVKNVKAANGKSTLRPTAMDFSTKTLTSLTASAKVEAGSLLSLPIFKQLKRVTILNTTLPNTAYVAVGQGNDVKKIGEAIGVSLPTADTKTVDVYFYDVNFTFLGRGTLNVGDSADSRIFNVNRDEVEGE